MTTIRNAECQPSVAPRSKERPTLIVILSVAKDLWPPVAPRSKERPYSRNCPFLFKLLKRSRDCKPFANSIQSLNLLLLSSISSKFRKYINYPILVVYLAHLGHISKCFIVPLFVCSNIPKSFCLVCCSVAICKVVTSFNGEEASNKLCILQILN